MVEREDIAPEVAGAGAFGPKSACERRILVGICAYDEARKLDRTVKGFGALTDVDVLVVDDGSTDGSIESLEPKICTVLRNDGNCGVGYSIRRVFLYARERGYDVVCLAAANDKDRPEDIGRLVAPILAGMADVVIGSRYAPGGAYGNMPLHRWVATRFVHPFFVLLLTRRWLSDTTNGFRAFRTACLDDSRLGLDQEWLDRYELEPYLLYKILTLGFRVTTVPVTKIYPPHVEGYSKIQPFTGWWSILRPYVFLALGLRK